MSLFPEPCPPSVDFGESQSFSGQYRRVQGGRTYLTRINQISSYWDPTGRPGRVRRVRGLTCIEYDYNDKRYDWWEATVMVFEGDYHFTVNEPKQKPVEILELEDNLFEQYLARKKWVQKYLDEGPTGSPVLDAFLSASNWAKTTYYEIRGNYAYLTYSVRYFYPYNRARFSNDVAAAFRVAKRCKANVRAIPAFAY